MATAAKAKNVFDNVKVAQVLRDGAIALHRTTVERDTLAADNAKLAADNNTLRLRMEAEKVAMDMRDKGMHTDVPFEALVEHLEKRAHADPQGFAVLREAVNLTGPDMMKAASVATNVNASGTSTDFERYILGDIE